MRLGDLITPAKVERCGDREFPVLSMTMHNGIVLQADRFKKAIASKDQSTYKVVKPGQLVVGFPIDEGVLYIQGYGHEGIMSPAYNVWDVDTKLIDTRYLELALHSPQSMSFYKEKMRGTTARRRSLPAATLVELDIPVPERREQIRVVDTLLGIRAGITDWKAWGERLDELVKSRFVEMFGDLSLNENGWQVLKFDDFATIDTHMTNDFESIADWPHIGIDSIESETGVISGYRTVAEDGVRSGKYPFTERHIIYSKIRPNLNKVALPSFAGVCSADAYPILPTEGVCNREYLAFVMRSKLFLDYILPLSGRAQMPKVNKNAVRGFAMPVPPFALQQEFAVFVQQVDKLKFETQQAIDKLQMLYDSLAQEYFGGE